MVKVLIVDDSSMDRYIIKTCLLKLGMDVVGEAFDKETAVSMYKKTLPDVTLLDIVMQNDNGIDILQEIMNYDKHAKIIMCSANSIQYNVINSSIEGAKYFIAKPITPEILAKAIKKCIGVKKKRFFPEETKV